MRGLIPGIAFHGRVLLGRGLYFFFFQWDLYGFQVQDDCSASTLRSKVRVSQHLCECVCVVGMKVMTGRYESYL